MIEIPLQRRERNHPAAEIGADGIGHGQWFGRQARWYDDCTPIEHTPRRKMDIIHANFEEVLVQIAEAYEAPIILEKVIDIEFCGSRACFNENKFSDIDVQLACANERDQRTVERIINRKPSIIKTIVQQFAMTMKINLEIHYSVHNNKEYNEVYSLRERKLYNREDGEPRPEGFHRKFNRETMRYEVRTKNRYHDSDYWDQDGNERLSILSANEGGVT